MKLTTVENGGHCLSIRRLTESCVADIKSSINIWLIFLLFFSGAYLLSLALNGLLRWSGNTPIPLLVTPNELLLLIPLLALLIVVGGRIDLSLLSPQVFTFDQEKNTFSVDGCVISRLDKVTVRLQDGFGPSRRAFRLVVTASSSDYVIAQTQRYTTATFFGKEYSLAKSILTLQRAKGLTENTISTVGPTMQELGPAFLPSGPIIKRYSPCILNYCSSLRPPKANYKLKENDEYLS